MISVYCGVFSIALTGGFMKKKVVLFTNGWANENVGALVDGMLDAFPENFADVFAFVAYNSYGRSEETNKSECLVYSIPDLKSYDFAVIFSPGLNSIEARDYIYSKCEEAGIHTICIGDTHPGFYSVCVNNAVGMRAACEHLRTKHGIKSIKMVAGSRDNKDSNIRIDVVETYAKENGIEFDRDDIFYSNWETNTTLQYIGDNYSVGSKLPDVFICANDQLAMATCTALESRGLNVPEDVLVTGFDYLKESQNYYPSIASVDQHFDVIGGMCAEIMKKIIAGKPCAETNIVLSEFIPGESCGCDSPRKEDAIRRRFCHNLITKYYEDDLRESRIYAVERAILSSERFSTLPEKMNEVFFREDAPKDDTFYMMLNPAFDKVAYDAKNLPKHEYSNMMQVIVAKEKGKLVDEAFCRTVDVIPGFTECDTNRVYAIFSLYIGDFACGYFVLDYATKSNDFMIYPGWTKSMHKALRQYKTNIQLTALNDKMTELMQTDALTSLKNRHAFENAKAQLKRSILSGAENPFAIAMFDVNNLKVINDRFGHEAGDAYIKRASVLICNTFKHSPVFRIGGDEFVVIVSNSDYVFRDDLLVQFRDAVVDPTKQDFEDNSQVSVASGMADYMEFAQGDFEDVFNKADEEMYANKYKMKNGNVR